MTDRSAPPLQMPSQGSPRRMVPALLLCGLLGPFGAHRFYTGKLITGTLQLLSTCSAVGWVLVDFPFRNGDLNVGLLLGQLVALLCCNLWPSLDFCRLISGKFTDRNEKKIAA